MKSTKQRKGEKQEGNWYSLEDTTQARQQVYIKIWERERERESARVWNFKKKILNLPTLFHRSCSTG